jgi:tetratricopeptide (TPR) repeat protein
MAAYAGAIRAAPQDPAAYDGLGELLRLTGRSDESMAAWRTALALDPAFVDARFHLAVALWSASRRGEAISEMERLVVQRPEHGRAHAQLARWHFYGGDREAALRHLQAAQAAGTPLPPRLLDALDAGR